MRFGVVVFPGSNCDRDCYHVIKEVMEEPVEYIWHKEKSLSAIMRLCHSDQSITLI
jgi:phosphoribosylformylglycinamidine (FGAM) synthase-like amidotransferase family enzyme